MTFQLADLNWILGEPSETCDTVCAKRNRICNSYEQSKITNVERVNSAMLAAGQRCKNVMGPRDYDGVPFYCAETCVYLKEGSTSVCNFTQLTGLYGLGYLNIGSLGIAVYRLLYMKHEHFVKYVVGEQLLLWIILSVGLVLTGTLLYLFTLESSSYRFHMNMCYGWSITDAQSWLEYEHYSGHPIITTTYLQTTSIAACLFIQSIEFGICAWFLQHRYKRDNGNIKKFLTQEAVRERNVKNISTFVGQFYCFVTEYSFLIIVFIFTFLADENSPDFKALAVILKFADFGLLSFVEVLSSPPLRAFMKQSI